MEGKITKLLLANEGKHFLLIRGKILGHDWLKVETLYLVDYNRNIKNPQCFIN